MGLFGGSHHHHENEQAYNAFYGQEEVPHEAKLSHEMLGGAAAFYAMRKYEEHLANTGEQPSHALFKEFLAGAAGFEVDRLVETKGLDSIDRHRAKRHAEDQAEQMYFAKYQPDRYQPPPQDWSYGAGGPRYQGGPPQGYGGGSGYGQGGGYGQQGEYQGEPGGGFGQQGGFQGGQGGGYGQQGGFGGAQQGYGGTY